MAYKIEYNNNTYDIPDSEYKSVVECINFNDGWDIIEEAIAEIPSRDLPLAKGLPDVFFDEVKDILHSKYDKTQIVLKSGRSFGSVISGR